MADNLIVERLAAAEGLRMERALFEQAQHAAKIGTWVLELDGSDRIVFSAEALRIAGLSGDTFDGHVSAYRALIDSDDRETVRIARDTAVATGKPYDVEYRIVRPDGACRWIHSVAEVIHDDRGRPLRLAGIVQDVTEQHALSAQLRQAHKMEAIGRLAGGVAHDFNNILTAISGHAEFLADELGNHPGVQEIIKAAASGARLTRQLLAFSRQQHLRPSVVDVTQIVRGMAGMLRRLIGEDVRLEVNVADDVPAIKADPGQLEQIILNLVINARDALPDGGRIVLSTASLRWSGGDPHRAVMPPGHYAAIRVEDTGTGIPADILPHVFEPFFTTKGTGGTGLGLATVYGIVKQSGGFVWVDSRVNGGTTFSVEFPATAAAVMEDAVARTSAAADRDERRRTILVVEDQDNVRRIAVRFLEAEGHCILESASPNDALAMVEQHGAHVDLLVTDVVMPFMMGTELSRRLRQRWPSLRTVYMSGFSKEHLEDARDALFVPKPFNRATFVNKVREALSWPGPDAGGGAARQLT